MKNRLELDRVELCMCVIITSDKRAFVVFRRVDASVVVSKLWHASAEASI